MRNKTQNNNWDGYFKNSRLFMKPGIHMIFRTTFSFMAMLLLWKLSIKDWIEKISKDLINKQAANKIAKKFFNKEVLRTFLSAAIMNSAGDIIGDSCKEAKKAIYSSFEITSDSSFFKKKMADLLSLIGAIKLTAITALSLNITISAVFGVPRMNIKSMFKFCVAYIGKRLTGWAGDVGGEVADRVVELGFSKVEECLNNSPNTTQIANASIDGLVKIASNVMLTQYGHLGMGSNNNPSHYDYKGSPLLSKYHVRLKN